MQEIDMDFEWPRASYRLASPKEYEKAWASAHDGSRLISRYGALVVTGKPHMHKPTTKELNHAVQLLATANDSTLANYALLVARTVGLLFGDSRPGDFEALDRWEGVSDGLRTIIGADDSRGAGLGAWNNVQIKADSYRKRDVNEPIFPGHKAELIGRVLDVKKGQFPTVGTMDLVFVTKGREKPKIAFRPQTLIDAFTLHAARLATGGASLRHCEFCSNSFVTGGKHASGQKIASARFCSDQCRSDFHNARKKKA